jgi:hypothetical protein
VRDGEKSIAEDPRLRLLGRSFGVASTTSSSSFAGGSTATASDCRRSGVEATTFSTIVALLAVAVALGRFLDGVNVEIAVILSDLTLLTSSWLKSVIA